MSLTIFLGAGFSKWAAGLPTVNELFDFHIDPWPREKAKFKLVKFLKYRWDQEYPNDNPEKFIAAALTLPQKQKEAIVWYIGRRLSEPFIYEYSSGYSGLRRHIPNIDNVYLFKDWGTSSVNKARTFLMQFCGPLLNGIITTNYDLLIEYALGSKMFNYGERYQYLKGYGGRKGLTTYIQLKGRLPVLKLHGSLSWDANECYADGRCGLTGKALIVPPTPDKKPQHLLPLQWQLASQTLNKSKYLLVFGYAFNPYDEAVLDLIKQASSNLKSVLLIDVNPRPDRIENLLPNTLVTPCLPPPVGNDVIQSWLWKAMYQAI